MKDHKKPETKREKGRKRRYRDKRGKKRGKKEKAKRVSSSSDSIPFRIFLNPSSSTNSDTPPHTASANISGYGR
jgi:hypothetical protein